MRGILFGGSRAVAEIPIPKSPALRDRLIRKADCKRNIAGGGRTVKTRRRRRAGEHLNIIRFRCARFTAGICHRQLDGVVIGGLINMCGVRLGRSVAIAEIPSPCAGVGNGRGLIGENHRQRRASGNRRGVKVDSRQGGNGEVSLFGFCAGIAGGIRHRQLDRVGASGRVAVRRILLGGGHAVAKIPQPRIDRAGGLIGKLHRDRRTTGRHICCKFGRDGVDDNDVIRLDGRQRITGAANGQRN
ncbi:MAG: hypothetical protein ALAOOOJD_00273 [bacterium]|nr:hypothetical protein [bacterium]